MPKTKKKPAKTARIVADVPIEVHKALRIHCIQRGVDVRDFIVELLAEKGIR